jgi:ribosomal protein L40E
MPHAVCYRCNAELVDPQAVICVECHEEAVRELLRYREALRAQVALEAKRGRAGAS